MSNSNYMGSGLAQTLAEKPSKNQLADGNMGLMAAASATSLTLTNYHVPSLDGKFLPAVPLHLALKFKPPTIAVVYNMKDASQRFILDKRGQHKKFHHGIPVDFTGSSNLRQMCQELCKKEVQYLNPQFINHQQVYVLLEKLHKNYLENNPGAAAPKASEPDSGDKTGSKDTAGTAFDKDKPRKANFFDRKRFVDYEQNEDSDKDQKENEIKNDDIHLNFDEPKHEVEEEEFHGGNKKKGKVDAVRSAHPAKKHEDKKLQEEIKPEIKQQENKIEANSPVKIEPEKAMAEIQKNKKVDNDFAMDLDDEKSGDTEKKSDKDGFSDNYEDDNWDMSDHDLQLQDKQHDKKKEEPKHKGMGLDLKLDSIHKDENQGVHHGASPDKSSDDRHKDFFGTHLDGSNSDKYSDFDMDAIEKEAAGGHLEKKNGNMFGQSITKELLAQSRKEIANDLGPESSGDDKFDFPNDHEQQQNQEGHKPELDHSKSGGAVAKKNLAIDIDENADYDSQHHQAQMVMNDKLMENEKYSNMLDGIDDEEEVPESQIIEEFDNLYHKDPELKKMLGEFPERYSIEEKCSIVQAYKKGGGVAGLAEIIDDEEESDEDKGHHQGSSPDQQRGQAHHGMNDDEEEVDIDLEDPEDVKVIETEFKKLYETDADFRNSFGEEAFDLDIMQKYSIIDAYNQGGMPAVLNLLSQSADQSGIMQQMEHGYDQQHEQEESMIEHEGKQYTKVQIQGLGDEEMYLMDNDGNIFSLDFKFITNMGSNNVEIDDE